MNSMFKKIIYCFLLLVVIFITPNVFAKSEWPIQVEVDDFTVNISGIDLKVYSMVRKTGEKELIKTINLPVSNYEVSFKTGNVKYIESDLTLVKMNLPITKDIILPYVEEAIKDVSTKDIYFIELVLNSNIVNYPVDYYAYNYDLFDTILKNSLEFPLVDLKDNVEFVINSAFCYKTEEGLIFNLLEKVDLTFGRADSLDYGSTINFKIFSKTKTDNNIYAGELKDEKILMFTTVEGYNVLLSQDENSEMSGISYKVLSDAGKVEGEIQYREEVKVLDTSLSIPSIIYVIGGVFIILGSAIIFINVFNKKGAN